MSPCHWPCASAPLPPAGPPLTASHARALATWQAVDQVLAPLMGRQAVAALYLRSLQLAGRQHPGWSVVLEGAPAAGDFSGLGGLLAHLAEPAAEAAEAALVQALQGVLAGLVGGPLARQLLPFLAWPDVPGRLPQTLHSGPAAQDIPP